uniref:Uncharacterized protein n=1 Tax=Glossina palpalis gambiensis TaxID=67801 RepID=A0A1B0BQP1_9MUSC
MDLKLSLKEFDKSFKLKTTATTRKWNPTRFTASNRTGRTIEIVVAVPILWSFNAAALQPIFLYPVN